MASFDQKLRTLYLMEGLDDATGEKEYTMLWQQKQKADFEGGRILYGVTAPFYLTKQMIYHGDCGWRFDE